jgi:disulfide bond formation protein DsbB
VAARTLGAPARVVVADVCPASAPTRASPKELMSIDQVSLFLALLAMLAEIGAVGLVAAVVVHAVRPAARWPVDLLDAVRPVALLFAAGVAIVSTLGSLYYSEIADFPPCRLCWFQRIGMYPLAAILLIAALRRDIRGGALYGLPLAAFGAIVAIYHIYIEYHPEAETAGCKIGAPCTTKWIDKLGYVTIPVLALTAFLAIIALLSMALSRTTRSRAT